MDYTFYLTYNGQKTEIVEPIGFDGAKVRLNRAPETHGLSYEIQTNTMEYDGKAYQIIRNAWQTEGVLAKVALTILVSCGGEFDTLFEGYLSFYSYQEKKGDYCSVSIQSTRGGWEEMLSGNKDKQVAIDLNRSVVLPPKSVAFDDTAKVLAQTVYIGDKGNFTIPFDSTETVYGEYDTALKGTSQSPTYSTPAGIEPDGLVTLRVRWKIAYGNPNKKMMNISLGMIFNGWQSVVGGQLMSQLIVSETVNNDSGTIDYGAISAPAVGSIGIGNTYEIKFKPHPAFDGYSRHLTLYADIRGGDDKSWVSFLPDTEMHVVGVSSFRATTAKCVSLADALSRLTAEATDGGLTVHSSYYADNPRVLATGLAIRNSLMKDGSQPKLFTSLKQLLADLAAIDNVGLGVEGGKVVVEPVGYFYRDEVVLSLTDVAKLTREADHERMYSLLKTGYRKWETEGQNGLDAVCTLREYKTVLDTGTTLSRECSLVADSYTIEMTRRQQMGNNDKDWRYDSDCFTICLKSDGTVEQAAYGQNLVDPTTVYNARISPARMAMRHFSTMAAYARNLQNTVLEFAAGNGNYVAVTGLEGEDRPERNTMVDESSSITADMLNTGYQKPITMPEVLKFDYPLTYRQLNQLRSNPWGIIEVEGEPCYLRSITYRLADGMTEFELLPKYT